MAVSPSQSCGLGRRPSRRGLTIATPEASRCQPSSQEGQGLDTLRPGQETNARGRYGLGRCARQPSPILFEKESLTLRPRIIDTRSPAFDLPLPARRGGGAMVCAPGSFAVEAHRRRGLSFLRARRSLSCIRRPITRSSSQPARGRGVIQPRPGWLL
jgi:hypothetical protein